MSKKFERALLLCSERHSLFNSLSEILKEISSDVRNYDISRNIGTLDSMLQAQTLRMPFRFRSGWEKYFQKKLNDAMIDFIDTYRPQLVIVYNSEYLLPETCEKIKKGAILIFYLADSPFYTPQNNYYLTALSYADLILSPDSFWSKQLNTIGLKNTLYFIPGPDERYYHRLDDTSDFEGIQETGILYAGSSYFNSWGYKKALLMSKFTGFDFHLYGNSMWKRWFRYFPELKSRFVESGFIPVDTLNKMFNKTRLIPVDGNPGILNGFHLRAFEALSAGALPLIEARDDLEGLFFKGCDAELPLIRNYNDAGEIAGYYLRNENERKETVEALVSFIKSRYNTAGNAGLLLEALDRSI
jgi:hypothetical protein